MRPFGKRSIFPANKFFGLRTNLNAIESNVDPKFTFCHGGSALREAKYRQAR